MAQITSGEEGFQFIYHEGLAQHIYLCNVSNDYLLVVLFDKTVALGMVRVLARHTVEKLQDLLYELVMESEKASKFLDVEFRSLLKKELDKTFGLK